MILTKAFSLSISTRSSIERLGSSQNLVSKLATQIIDKSIKEVVDGFLSKDPTDESNLTLVPGLAMVIHSNLSGGVESSLPAIFPF